MGGVSLNFDEDRNLLIAKGETGKTIRLPLIRRLIIKHGGSMGPDGVLTIPCPQESLESLTRSFKKALAAYGIEFTFGDKLATRCCLRMRIYAKGEASLNDTVTR